MPPKGAEMYKSNARYVSVYISTLLTMLPIIKTTGMYINTIYKKPDGQTVANRTIYRPNGVAIDYCTG